MQQWVAGGANLEQIKAKQMLQDIQALREGKSISHPISGELIPSSPIIIIEDPTGKECEEYAALYDFVVFIDTPLEVCLARTVSRTIAARTAKFNNELSALSKEDLVKLVEEIKKYLSFQYWLRDVYIAVTDKVKPNVDLILNGDKPVEELVQAAVKEINKLVEN